jgi:hypothetical protein
MSTWIIVTRNPRKAKAKIVIIDDDDGEPAEFESEALAMEAAANTSVCKAWGFDTVEIEF